MNERRGTVLRIPSTRTIGQGDGIRDQTVIVRVYDHPPAAVKGVAQDTEVIQITSGGVKFPLWVRVIR